jgi:hypothetical protein
MTFFLSIIILFFSSCSNPEFSSKGFEKSFDNTSSIFNQHRIPNYSIIKRIGMKCMGTKATLKTECLRKILLKLKYKIDHSKSNNDPFELFELSQLLILFANTEKLTLESASYLKKSYELMQTINPKHSKKLKVLYGITYFHAAEMIECIQNKSPCLYPPENEAGQKSKKHYLIAQKYFKAYLDNNPNDLHIKFLYNITTRMLGEKVNHHLIKNEIFGKKKVSKQFTNISKELGLYDQQTSSGGVIIDDFNGDNYMDIVISSSNRTIYYEYSKINKCYKDKSKSSKLSNAINAYNVTQIDFDNDGDLDLYFHQGGWKKPNIDKNYFNILMENNGKGTFEDTTKKRGLRDSNNTNVASVWADFNRDGKIDLFVCNELQDPDLFINLGKKFKNIIKSSGIKNKDTCKGASWGDINGDDWPDLVISNYKSPNKIYINQKDSTFKIASYPKVQKKPFPSFPTWFFDYNNDGYEDLFISSHESNPSRFIDSLYGKTIEKMSQRLYRNDGDGSLKDVTKELGLNISPMAMGASYGDINNSGYLDILLGTGSGTYSSVVPNLTYLNKDGKFFEAATSTLGLGFRGKGHSINVTDIDNDGDKDILFSFGGMDSLFDHQYPQLMLNNGNTNNWITLLLEGTKSNRSALGAKIQVIAVKNGVENSYYQKITHGSSYGSQSFRSEIGLSSSKQIKNIIIKWPSGSVQKLGRLKINNFYKVKENKKDVTKLSLLKIPKSHFKTCTN